MTKENQFKVQSTIPKTETRIILNNWQQPVKQSGLSVAARKKIINYSGSNYVSPRMMADISEPAIYGPGKRNFRNFCRRIKDNLGGHITAKISHDSDRYISGNNYVGAIIYAIDGEFTWTNSGGDAAGRRGRSFYVIIKNTSDWWSQESNNSGYIGIASGYLIYKSLGIDLRVTDNNRRICAGGFACIDGNLRFNSGQLNLTNNDVCQSDGSSALSPDETEIVKYCWEQYLNHGPSHTFEIPSYLFE